MSGYEYGNTRLRAMRSRLLTRADYVDLMSAGSLDRMLAMLAETPYAPDVEAALVRSRGLDRLDRALRSNLADALSRMASFYDGRPREKVDLLVSRWDLANLRSLVRLLDAAIAVGDLSVLLVPAGRLGEPELHELAAQGDVGALIDLLVAWGIPSREAGFALLRARSTYLADGDVSALMLVIDGAFADEVERVLGSETGAAAGILRAETDARNLELALRLRSARIEGEPGWSELTDAHLAGGTQPPELWRDVADADAPETVLELVAGRVPVPGWAAALATWASEGGLGDLVDGLTRALTSAARSRFVRGDPLGFDIPLAFTFVKEAEVRNLRLIGRALVHGLPMAGIEGRLEVAA